MRQPSRLLTWIAFTSVIVGPNPAWPAEQLPPEDPSEPHVQLSLGIEWETVELEVAALEAELAERQTELGDLPKPSQGSTTGAEYRAVLDQRVSLLKELLEILSRRSAIESNAEQLDSERDRIAASRAELETLPPAAVPSEISAEGLGALEEQLAAARDAHAAAVATVTNQKRALAEINTVISESQERSKTARELAGSIQSAMDAAAEAAGVKDLMRLDNAQLEARIGGEWVQMSREEEKYLQVAIPVSEAERDLLKLELDRAEAAFNQYQSALAESQAREQMAAEAELRRRQQEAAQADTRFDRNLKSAEATLAEVRSNIAELNAFRTEIAKLVSEQQKFHEEDQSFFHELQTTVEAAQSARYAAGLLKSTYKQLGTKRAALRESVSSEVLRDLEKYQLRRFEVEGALFTYSERVEEWLERALEEIPRDEQEEFRRRISELEVDLAELLGEERALLTEVTGQGQKLSLLLVERSTILNELEKYLLSRVFWIQDEPPLGWDTVALAGREIGGRDDSRSLVRWWDRSTSSEAWQQLTEALGRPHSLLLQLLLLTGIPVAFLLVRRPLRRFVVSRNELALSTKVEGRRSPSLQVTLVALLSASVMPAYLFLLAWVLRTLDLPGSLDEAFCRLLDHVAVFVFLLLLARAFLLHRGISEAQFGVRRETTGHLLWAARFLLYAYLVLLLPWRLFTDVPFELKAFPRLGVTAFEVCVAIAAFRLLRPGASFVRQVDSTRLDVQGGTKSGASFLQRNFTLLRVGILTFVVLTLLLDMAGYRFGAMYLFKNALATTAVLVGLSMARRFVDPWVERILEKRKAQVEESQSTSTWFARYGDRLFDQTRRFVQVVFFLTGTTILVLLWGINDRVLDVLREAEVYGSVLADGTNTVVTVADILQAIVVMVVTVWILRNLPGIYELTVFPRVRMDAGLRYALVTISRYGLFVVGFVVALSSIRLDLSQIGWLVAAISVGLGFGLQEIVANFVSGIILLVERPIRVGDTVTVGTVTGKVSRINIRATTVLNWDRQEILVPNREMITQEVTNWTLHDAVTRLKILVRVPLETDVDRVRELLLELAKEQPEVLADPEPRALFMDQSDGCIELHLLVYLPDTALRLTLIDRLNDLVKKRLETHGIRIAFPRREVHVRSGAPLPSGGEESPRPKT